MTMGGVVLQLGGGNWGVQVAGGHGGGVMD